MPGQFAILEWQFENFNMCGTGYYINGGTYGGMRKAKLKCPNNVQGVSIQVKRYQNGRRGKKQ